MWYQSATQVLCKKIIKAESRKSKLKSYSEAEPVDHEESMKISIEDGIQSSTKRTWSR